MKETTNKKIRTFIDKKLTLFVAIVLLLVWALFFFTRTPQQPFSLTTDMGAPATYTKTISVAEKDPYTSTTYSKKTKEFLNSKPAEDFLGLRCSDTFLRTDQGAYILEHLRTGNMYKRRIKNDSFIEYMRDIEPTHTIGKKVVTGAICETANKDILLFYSIGKYNIGDIGQHTLSRVIAQSTENESFVLIFPNSQFASTRKVQINTSNDHTRCDKPFSVTKSFAVLVLCSEEKVNTTVYTVKQVDTQAGQVSVIETCSNTFGNTLQTTCH